MSAEENTLSHFFYNLVLVFCGSLFFALAHPGFLFPRGLSFFAWFMWTPVFFLVRRSPLKTAWLWGGLYGAFSNGLLVSWLVTFSAVAALAISVEYFVSYALLFLLLKVSERFCGRHSWISSLLILGTHEYVKTLGFAGFSYGVSGYTQWRNLVLLQSASLFGVWGVSFLIDFSSALLYKILLDAKTRFGETQTLLAENAPRGDKTLPAENAPRDTRASLSKNAPRGAKVGGAKTHGAKARLGEAQTAGAKAGGAKTHGAKARLGETQTAGVKGAGVFQINNFRCGSRAVLGAIKSHVLSVAIFAACLCFFVIFGAATLSREKEPERFVKVAAVQHNTDPWVGGIASYERDVKTLMRLTDAALAEQPDTQIVVWPETAVVPSIMTHYAMRRDRRRFDLINSVLQYIDEKDAVFVIGNFDSVDTGASRTSDYNSAFVFTPKKNVVPPNPEVYRKIHLVPFTESVPLAENFPWLYDALEKADTHLWEQGDERTVFHAAGISFSVPICFEDTFGNDCREFVKAGARAFVNMSNDAWSKSLSCQNQHLSMAVFRCAESRVPAVRSTASGQTCIVGVDGRMLAEAAPFAETYVAGAMPVAGEGAGNTLYDKIGDALAIFVLCAALVVGGVFIVLEARGKQ